MKGDVEELAKRVYSISNSAENDKNQAQFSEEHFRQIYFYDPPPKPSFASQLKSVRCHSRWLLKVFPILEWLPAYKKANLIDDIISGLTVAVMHIPQGMAYALLGGVPPIVGIYMAFFPVLIYIVMGTSRHVSMGTFAVVCMMVGKSVDVYSHPPGRNLTEDTQQNLLYMPPTPTEIATVVCFAVGIWQVILSVLKLGSLSVLLSTTLVSGFTTGAAVHVFTSQVRNLLGIKVNRYAGPFKIVYSYMDIFQNISDLNTLAAVLSASFITFLFIFNELVKPYLQKKLKKTVPVPAELIVVIIGTLLSQNFNMKEEFGLAVVDSVPTGLPKPVLPPLHLLSGIITDGLVIAIVAISINLSMASIFSQKFGYEIDANQEILASGVGNVFSSFFSCMPCAVSLSRSLIQQTVGGHTQIASVVSCVTLVFVMLFVGPFFEPLPYSVLSTIIVVSLKGMFKQFGDVPGIFRNSKLDGLVWVVTFLGVVLLDIDYGLGIGLVLSLMTLMIYSQKINVVVLGRLPSTEIYVDVNRFRKSQVFPKILIMQIIGGLHFANSVAVRKKIMKSFVEFSQNCFPVGLVSAEKQTKCLTLIIDLSCVPFVDPSAIKSLGILYDDLANLQSNLLFCGGVSYVYDSINNSEYFLNYPKSLFFHNLHDAVEYAKGLENSYYPDGVTGDFVSKF